MRRFAATIRGQGVDPDYQAVLDFAVSQGITLPNQTQQNIDNQLLIDYKAEGLWNLDDVFFKFKGDYSDNSFRLIDWKRLILADDFGAVGYSNQGIAGNKTNAYIDTKYNPNIDGVKFTLNDNAITLYQHTTGSLNTSAMMKYGIFQQTPNQSQITLLDKRIDGTTLVYSNNGEFTRKANYSSLGISIMDRNTSENVAYTSDVTREINHNSKYIPSYNMYLLCRNDEGTPQLFSDATFSYFTMGASRRNKVTEIKNILV